MALRLSRRTLLRGAGATLALPLLETMIPSRASAALGAAPVRTVFIGLEGGIWTGADGFFPYKDGTDEERNKVWGKNAILPGGHTADVGPDYKLTQTLQPLAEVRKDVLILSGLHHRNDLLTSPVLGDHGQDLGTLLTGFDISSTPGVTIKNGISFDQVLAAKIGEVTRFPSLQLAVGQTSYNTKEATGLGYMGFLSYDADGYALPVEGDPAQAFDQLFTDGTSRQQAERDADRRRLKSVLDAVHEDMKRLKTSVALQDRRKLEEYAATVREVERRIERAKAWEGKPVRLPPGTKRPDASRKSDGSGSHRSEEIRLMLDVLALALQVDVSRIATLRMGGYYGSFSFLGFPQDPHGVYAHNGGDPEKIKGCRAIDRFHVEQLAYFLKRLKGVSEGSGTLLDHTAVLYGAGLTNGLDRARHVISYQAHGQVNTPILVAGRGGGALKSGRHVNYDHGTPLANLFVVLAGLAGVRDFSFADSTGPLGGLV